MVYFCETICCLKLAKIAQFGHTGCNAFDMEKRDLTNGQTEKLGKERERVNKNAR